MLRFRDALPEQIEVDPDTDRFCSDCGYNLRGLVGGRNCPECGCPEFETEEEWSSEVRSEVSRSRRPRRDLTLRGEETERTRWRIGFAMAASAVAAALTARVLLFLIAIVTAVTGAGLVGPRMMLMYHSALAVNTLMFIVAVWMLTPRSIDQHDRRLRVPRLLARGLVLFWIPAYACLMLGLLASAGSTLPEVMRVPNQVLRLLAGLGVIVAAGVLHVIAEDAERDDAARRFNNVTWFLPWPTLLLGLVPSVITWVTAILVGFVLFFWGWLMMTFFFALREMHGHTRWASVHAVQAVGRDERIAVTRARLQREADSGVRAIPRTAESDIEIEGE